MARQFDGNTCCTTRPWVCTIGVAASSNGLFLVSNPGSDAFGYQNFLNVLANGPGPNLVGFIPQSASAFAVYEAACTALSNGQTHQGWSVSQPVTADDLFHPEQTKPPIGTDFAGSWKGTAACLPIGLNFATDDGVAAADDDGSYIDCYAPFDPCRLQFLGNFNSELTVQLILRARGRNDFHGGGGQVRLSTIVNNVVIDAYEPTLTSDYETFERVLAGSWTAADIVSLRLEVLQLGGGDRDVRMTAFEYATATAVCPLANIVNVRAHVGHFSSALVGLSNDFVTPSSNPPASQPAIFQTIFVGNGLSLTTRLCAYVFGPLQHGRTGRDWFKSFDITLDPPVGNYLTESFHLHAFREFAPGARWDHDSCGDAAVAPSENYRFFLGMCRGDSTSLNTTALIRIFQALHNGTSSAFVELDQIGSLSLAGSPATFSYDDNVPGDGSGVDIEAVGAGVTNYFFLGIVGSPCLTAAPWTPSVNPPSALSTPIGSPPQELLVVVGGNSRNLDVTKVATVSKFSYRS